MPSPPRPSRRLLTVLLALVLTPPALLSSAAATGGGDAATSAGPAATAPVIRVNQVGYATGEPIVAQVMASAPLGDARIEVVDEAGDVVSTGPLGPDVGPWSPRWPHVHRAEAPSLAPGHYRLVLAGEDDVSSPVFEVAPAGELYRPLAANGVRFFQAQRDGADVLPEVMRRRPSHLADRSARLHAPPRYRDGRLLGRLRPAGGRVDVSGGWFDAGDYLKFVETTSYAAALLLVAARDAAQPVPGLREEAAYGVDWLERAWLDRSRRLVYQVGLGDGRPGLLGDHDAWRLPETDDRRQVRPGDPDYYLEHRPAFVTGGRDQRISPNLAGRTAAVFALAAQLAADRDPARARALLRQARVVLSRARTRDVGRLLTTSPHSYYEEDEWRDDLELGAVEIALAGQALGVPPRRQRADLRLAARWARAYLRSPRHGWYTLARDDQSALAHADLVQAMAAHPDLSLAVGREELVGDLEAQLRIARRRYAAPLGFGGREDPGADFALGAAVTARLRQRLTGGSVPAAIGAELRDWTLGANAWGTSLVIGAGSTYPHCPHHQVANILGSRPGFGEELVGAVSNGPVAAGYLRGLGAPGAYAEPCSAGAGWARFDGQGARYLDDVRAYAATEPALDYVAVSVLAFVLEADATG
ncbi:glycoside hydrolase family 9 protein [Nocardioides ferulae]|uniref:glycoside hydrolase family 9 protein n=1 Tax=Nocardioides ferulae TaxID=2340821 RepID=UPI0013DE20D2|nr:glycoside hydrolase family 9 protein [Nocardioides ferulae]